ncbi:MAG TPA: potassium-transporting ATPase subunit KdpA, partial [Actinomycetes bacterium]|nr:potassium-transporting ATPase subunit KdpA [Actinomycetes bacterium]
MLVGDLVQPLVLLAAVIALTPPLGAYIARVMNGERTVLQPVLGPVERLVYRGLRLRPDREQTWRAYARAMLVFSLVSVVVLYVLQRAQGLLPLNPDGFGAVDPYLALNTAVSFVTNTDWQNYLGEQTMSHLTQMAGLAVQNFLSAGVGLAVAVALIRGLARRRADTIGNFWVDLTRGVVFVLLPLSILLGVLLMARGVVQNFDGLRQVTTVGGATQTLPGGPVA